jgi:hypothetical protein
MRLLIAALLPLPALAAAPAGLHFTHHDWEVACDNTRTCRAAGYQSEETAAPAVSVLLERKAGANQPVTGTLRIGDYDEDAPAPQTALAMKIDGRPLGQVRLDPNSMTAPLAAPQTAALLTALGGSGQVTWSDGTQVWTLSGKGATAVLLKMDEFQGRLGTSGALLRKGGKAEHAVLPALAAPKVSPAPAGETDVALAPPARASLLRELLGKAAAGDCTEAQKEELVALQLTPDKLLVSMPCWMAAYNTGSAYWVTNRAAPWSPVLVTANGTDFAAGVISSAQKGRGLGDCWSSEEWTWDGRRFVLTKSATTGMCRMVAPGGAWDLPTYVARVTRGAR